MGSFNWGWQDKYANTNPMQDNKKLSEKLLTRDMVMNLLHLHTVGNLVCAFCFEMGFLILISLPIAA